MSAPVLGVDPGHEGGAVLLAADGRTVLAAWAWHQVTDGYVLHSLSPLGGLVETRAASINAIAQLMATHAATLDVPWWLVVEGLFVWPGRVIEGVLSLAEATGALMGPLADCAARVWRPQASSWRAAVLPRGWGTKSAQAERAAHGVCVATLRGLDAFLELGPEEVEEGRKVRNPVWPHVCEAACMARWGWVAGREASQMDLIASRSSGRR